MFSPSKELLAYVVGLAIGDGNLSNPNGRATRLRITCDAKYPLLIQRICTSIQGVLPKNKVSVVYKSAHCVDVSCYSNQWEQLLGWKAMNGSKYTQRVRVPNWIRSNKRYTIACLKGLFETDGSIYNDRGYIMANFVTTIPELAQDVTTMIDRLGFKPRIYRITLTKPKLPRYNIRISKNASQFIRTINLLKS